MCSWPMTTVPGRRSAGASRFSPGRVAITTPSPAAQSRRSSTRSVHSVLPSARRRSPGNSSRLRCGRRSSRSRPVSPPSGRSRLVVGGADLHAAREGEERAVARSRDADDLHLVAGAREVPRDVERRSDRAAHGVRVADEDRHPRPRAPRVADAARARRARGPGGGSPARAAAPRGGGPARAAVAARACGPARGPCGRRGCCASCRRAGSGGRPPRAGRTRRRGACPPPRRRGGRAAARRGSRSQNSGSSPAASSAAYGTRTSNAGPSSVAGTATSRPSARRRAVSSRAPSPPTSSPRTRMRIVGDLDAVDLGVGCHQDAVVGSGRRQKEETVGAPGFEPGTSPTRTVRATRLRHAPRSPSLGQTRTNRGCETAFPVTLEGRCDGQWEDSSRLSCCARRPRQVRSWAGQRSRTASCAMSRTSRSPAPAAAPGR